MGLVGFIQGKLCFCLLSFCKSFIAAIASAPLPLHCLSSNSSPSNLSQCCTDSRAGLSSKGDRWTALLRVRLTASPFSLTREKQLLEGESIFISSLADGGRIDIKGDSARGKGMWLRKAGTGRGRLGKSDQGAARRPKRMSEGLRDHRKKANLEDETGEMVQGLRSIES